MKKKFTVILGALILALSSCSSPTNPTSAETTTTAAAATTKAEAATTTAAETTTTTAAETTTTTASETTTTTAAETTTTTTTTAETTTEEQTTAKVTEAETTVPETTTAETSAAVTTTANTTIEEEHMTESTTKKPGIFDNIGATTTLAPNEGVDSRGNKYVDVVFDSLPTTYEEFIALPQASLSTVYDTAAMTVLALCFYPSDPELSMKMYEYVSGPRTINNAEYSFIKDRFRDYDYVPRSYFTGATPDNDYKPSVPYTVRVTENPYTYANDGYAKMFLRSGGADSERNVMLRKGKDGKWYLWEQFILVGIREPSSASPWA